MSLINAHAHSPLSIGGCVLWLEGNDPSGNGTQPANATSISNWTDKSKAGWFAFSQGTLANRPLYNSTARNGRGGVAFTGTSTHYLTSALSATNLNFGTMPFTIFYVVTGVTGGCILYRGALIGTWASPGKKIWFGNGTTTETTVGLRPSMVGAGQNQAIGNTAIVNPSILTVVGDTSAPRITYYRNSSSTADTNSTNTYAPVSDGTLANIFMGAGPGSTSFTGTICEVLIYNKVLTAQERLTVTNLLARKYNIVVS